MLDRHEGEVISFLNTVEDVGCCTVRTNVLKGWFGLTNTSKNVWRELHAAWEKIADVPLLVGEGNGCYAFVYGDGLTVEKKDGKAKGWLVNITDWF